MNALPKSKCGRKSWLFRYLLVGVGVILFWGCGAGDTSEPDNGETGTASVAITWHQSKSSRYYAENERSIQALSDDCNTEGVTTIQCAVYDEDDILLIEGDEWSCNANNGTMEGIAAGENRTVVCLGRNTAGEIVHLGQQGGVAIQSGSNQEVDIDSHPFRTTIEYPPTGGPPLQANNFEMTWRNVNNASQYKIEIADNPQFNIITDDDGISTFTSETSFYPSTLLGDVDYYWRITPYDKYDNSGAPSETGQFTTLRGQNCFRPELNPIGNQIVIEGQPLDFPVSINEERIRDGEGQLTFDDPVGLPAGTQYQYDPISDYRYDFFWTPTITGSARTQDVNFQVCNTCDDQGPFCDNEVVRIAIMQAGSGGNQCQAVQMEEIGDREEEVGEVLSFPITASGAAQLAYSAALIRQNGAAVPTGTPLPDGAVFDSNPSSPNFRWTPGDTQDGEYVVRFTVTNAVANCTGISVYEDVTITVTPANGGVDPCQAVELETIGTHSAPLGELLSFPVSGSGADQLSYSAELISPAGATLPPGAEFVSDSISGTFSWTPDGTQVQVGDIYVIRFTVTNATADCGHINDSEDVTINVSDPAAVP